MRLVPLFFIILPLVELWLLIEVGALIGALPTVTGVVLSALGGVVLLRHQGVGALSRVRQRLAAGELPAEEMLEAMVLALSGLMLVAPGFITDTLGLLGLIPPLRRWLVARIVPRMVVSAAAGRRGEGPRTLEGEFWREDDRSR